MPALKVLLAVAVLLTAPDRLALLAQMAGQPFYVQFTMAAMKEQKVVLERFDKTEFRPIDSTHSENGSFYFSFSESDLPGTYVVRFPQSEGKDGQPGGYIEFVWNHENVEISGNMDDLARSVTIGGSLENDVLGMFRNFENDYQQKLNAIIPVLDRYPENDAYYISTVRHYASLQRKRDSLILALLEQYPGLYASKIIASFRTPNVPPRLSSSEKVQFMRDHFFDRAPIKEPALLHSPVYTRKIIDYLSLYRGQELTFAEQEDAFIEAVDVIMANVSAEAELRTFVIEYLMEGFNSFQMEKVQAHIADTYLDETCTTDALQLAKERAEGYKKMAVGNVTADITIRNDRASTIRLSDVDADYTLLVFWASHCGHCLKLMPKLKEWYHDDRPDNLEVFAISIDTVKQEWTRYLEAANLPWINAHEPLGWEGRSAGDYNIYATPTMFLLDRQRKILAKPMGVWEIRKAVREISK